MLRARAPSMSRIPITPETEPITIHFEIYMPSPRAPFKIFCPADEQCRLLPSSPYSSRDASFMNVIAHYGGGIMIAFDSVPPLHVSPRGGLVDVLWAATSDVEKLALASPFYEPLKQMQRVSGALVTALPPRDPLVVQTLFLCKELAASGEKISDSAWLSAEFVRIQLSLPLKDEYVSDNNA